MRVDRPQPQSRVCRYVYSRRNQGIIISKEGIGCIQTAIVPSVTLGFSVHGGCQSGLSLALGSAQCLPCSNDYLALLDDCMGQKGLL